MLGHLGDAGMQKALVPPTAAGPAYKCPVTFSLWVLSAPGGLSKVVCTSRGIHLQMDLLGLLAASGNSLCSVPLFRQG